MGETKSFEIPKKMVMDAYRQVKKNKGAAGIDDSYGYRPKKSAHQALAATRKRCWKYDRVIDMDIKGFFDNIDHELLLKAVDFQKPPVWVRLYIERWLTAKIVDESGGERTPDKGTPQGGVISPLLANLYLHYTFDLWIKRNYGHIVFERYADDGAPRRHRKGAFMKVA